MELPDSVIKSIRTEQPLRKVNFLPYKPSQCSSVFWVCKCLCQPAEPWEGAAALRPTQSLASAPGSHHRALGVINLSGSVPLRRLSKNPPQRLSSPVLGHWRKEREAQHLHHQQEAPQGDFNLV